MAKPKAKAKTEKAGPGPRADFGAPVDGYIAKLKSPIKEIVVALRALVEEAAPDAVGMLKWGMPNYSIDGAMMCALTAHKQHVNLVLAGPPGSFDDPDGLLEGEGKTGRHLKLTAIDDLIRGRLAVKKWLKTAATIARKKA
jgi:hypothetical protein